MTQPLSFVIQRYATGTARPERLVQLNPPIWSRDYAQAMPFGTRLEANRIALNHMTVPVIVVHESDDAC